jgi:hypothetical protein
MLGVNHRRKLLDTQNTKNLPTTRVVQAIIIDYQTWTCGTILALVLVPVLVLGPVEAVARWASGFWAEPPGSSGTLAQSLFTDILLQPNQKPL